ncbi:hydrolase [Peptoniphilus raoultii]|uniref:hydrolase n=1 Tax=Peptoniphilus raoultii TaxID=1776387 RepID=UPI0008DAE2B3|nr:hydrolase [Peptoniphilus raoultii]
MTYKENSQEKYGTNDATNKSGKFIPQIETNLRKRQVIVPEAIYKASGINFMGKRIKSLLFSNDIPIICNTNAQAIMAVYPFTPELKIINAICEVASVPVFVGIGGAVTNGYRSLNIGMQAELMGAKGVVVNAPMANETIKQISEVLDVPVIATVLSLKDDIEGKVNAGARVLNVAGGTKTPELIKLCRKLLGDEFPIIATGGHSEEHILETIDAGANAITYTPQSSSEIFSEVMNSYREKMRKYSKI